ncbi:helix-turn-helix domain-containing protein [Emcibacter sp. SYSU 3D8]|uniref:winged helix-turn-helix transcriptional regulator n=1 Tax=Emcibacter sp. SYSU 3D8 TaxID=3133969 RepID=UPI0031FEE5CC
MANEHRSACPINLTVEVIGDKWSMLVLRDMIFGGRRHFRELLTKSDEGIASNILADRLRRLAEQGIITRADDPSHKQKAVYSLTEAGIQLLPVLCQMGMWGRRHMPVSEDMALRSRLLEEGGWPLIRALMDELREVHLGIPRPPGTPSVSAQLLAAYEGAVASLGRTPDTQIASNKN